MFHLNLVTINSNYSRCNLTPVKVCTCLLMSEVSFCGTAEHCYFLFHPTTQMHHHSLHIPVIVRVHQTLWKTDAHRP